MKNCRLPFISCVSVPYAYKRTWILQLLLFMAFVYSNTLCLATSGVITKDTTWSLANSPYTITGNVGVARGAKLTIEPGVIIHFSGNYEILVNGIVLANGFENSKIRFNGNFGGATFLKFKKSSLEDSQINHVIFENARYAIRIGQESEHNQGDKNSGQLRVDNAQFIEADILTDGYNTNASLLLVNAEINGSTVKGNYPRSEPVEIRDSRIVDSKIFSDSYNKGIKLVKCLIIESDAPIGCCGANLEIQESTLVDSLIRATNSSNRLEIKASRLIGTPVSLPSASSVRISNSVIDSKKVQKTVSQIDTTDYSTHYAQSVYSYALEVQNLTIDNTSLIGDGNISAIRIASALDAQNLLIKNFSKGIQLSGTRENNVKLQASNIFGVSGYLIENLTNKSVLAKNNFWGSTKKDVINSKVWDYYDDLNSEIVEYKPFATQTITNAPISPPTNVVKRVEADGVKISWDANPENDLVGYRVHFGSPTGYSYANAVNVGNLTSYTLAGVNINDSIAVTAYDAGAHGLHQTSTLFENQTNGSESWFATQVNRAPTITSHEGADSANILVPENQTAVTTFTAIDPDGDVLSYSLSGQLWEDAHRFSVHPTSGVLTFNNAPDYENPHDDDFGGTHTFVLSVSDGTLVDSQSISVTVTDVDEIQTNKSESRFSKADQVGIISITDANFKLAVKLWFTDEASATTTYGPISDWNVSQVTDPIYPFLRNSSFNYSNQTLQSQVETMTVEIDSLNGQVSSLTQENQELSGQISNLREDNQNLQCEVTIKTLENEQILTIAQTPFVNGWVYDDEQGWLFTDADHYPLIFSDATNSWHYYEMGSSEPRMFYSFSSEIWEAWDAIPSETTY